MHRSAVLPTQHPPNPPSVYYRRDVETWTVDKFVAAMAGAFGLCMEEASRCLQNLTLEKAEVVKEAMGIHCHSPELSNAVYQSFAERLRRHGEEWHKAAEVLERAVATPFPELWRKQLGAPCPQHQWAVRRLWEDLFGEDAFSPSSSPPDLGDLWQTCGWRWPTEHFPLELTPWSGFMNQLHWCIALVQLRLAAEGKHESTLIICGQRTEEYVARLRQRQVGFYQ